MLVTLVEVKEVVEVADVVRHLMMQVLACWIPEFKLLEFESGVPDVAELTSRAANVLRKSKAMTEDNPRTSSFFLSSLVFKVFLLEFQRVHLSVVAHLFQIEFM